MHINDTGDLNAEFSAEQEHVHSFFNNNFFDSDDPLDSVYVTAKDIMNSLMITFPNAELTEAMITSWLEGKFRRREIGVTDIKIVWAISRRRN